MNLFEALSKFEVQLLANGRSEHTMGQYRRHVRLFASWAREVGHSGELEDVSHEEVALFLTSPGANSRPDGRKKKATAMNALRTSLRCFFRYLHEAGYISSNPGRLIRRAKCGQAPPRAFSEAEISRLLENLAAATSPEGRRDHALIHLMVATGVRLSSAISLEISDIDFESGMLWLHTMKGDQPERVFLGQGIQEHLLKFIGERTTGPLFQGNHGGFLSRRHVHRRFKAWCARARIPQLATLHSLRHSFATQLYRKTGDVLLVQTALRHRSITSTIVYAKPDEARLQRALV